MTTETEYKAVIKNIDKNKFVVFNDGRFSHTSNIEEATCFFDEYDADITIDRLNENNEDCFTLLTL